MIKQTYKKALIMLTIIFSAISIFLPAISYADIGPSIGETTGGQYLNIQESTILQGTDGQPSQLETNITNAINWGASIAIGFFVMKVIMTAVDRFALAESQSPFRLSEIPIIGAYKDPRERNKWTEHSQQSTNRLQGNPQDQEPVWTWKQIFKHFIKNIIIIVGIWVILGIIQGFLVSSTALLMQQNITN